MWFIVLLEFLVHISDDHASLPNSSGSHGLTSTALRGNRVFDIVCNFWEVGPKVTAAEFTWQSSFWSKTRSIGTSTWLLDLWRAFSFLQVSPSTFAQFVGSLFIEALGLASTWRNTSRSLRFEAIIALSEYSVCDPFN